jgi:phosphate transport system substrate-binding protein
MRARLLAPLLVVILATGVLTAASSPAGAAPARVNGSGSTYVALAMQQWVADAQTAGLSVNYLPTGSPDGLTSYANGLTDFAGTEAEFSALSGGVDSVPPRGFQYTPDVAGAVAIMYNVDDQAGRTVDYLHLSRETIAKIFMGYITNWDDPEITADNKGLVLPNEPISVVYRSGQSGTTALFYDFVQHTDPTLFAQWAAKNRLPTDVRIVQLDSSPSFAPKTIALSGSDQIAQFVGSPNGKWSITYDEFGYAVTYHVPAAWVENAAGNWVQPYAENISAALESATLRPDLSQELSGVYASTNPDAYPISAYSYIVTQCAPSADRATCHGPYSNPGIAETFAQWMRYIACDGQVNMAQIGYSPLPPNLSQEVANSVGRLEGTPPESLNASNCSNPRFRGSLGAGAASPPDPLANVASIGGGASSNGSSSSASGGGAPTQTTVAGAAAEASSASARDPAALRTAGGSSTFRALSPVPYRRPGPGSASSLPLLAFVALVVIPPVVLAAVSFARRRRRLRAKPAG